MEEHVYRTVHELEGRHWWFRGRRAVIWSLLRRAGVDRPLETLDAGCGTGRNLEEYARLGPAFGIDPSEAAVRFCHRRGLENVRQAEVESLPFRDDRFGLICATDVLEHVPDDLRALRELRRVAVPGGLLLVTVPAYMWLWSDSDVALHHQRRYTRPQLAERAAAAGWKPVLETYFNTLLLPPIALARKLRPDKAEARSELTGTSPALDGVLSLPMRFEAALIARGVRLPAGVSLGLVAAARS